MEGTQFHIELDSSVVNLRKKEEEQTNLSDAEFYRLTNELYLLRSENRVLRRKIMQVRQAIRRLMALAADPEQK